MENNIAQGGQPDCHAAQWLNVLPYRAEEQVVIGRKDRQTFTLRKSAALDRKRSKRPNLGASYSVGCPNALDVANSSELVAALGLRYVCESRG